MTIPFTCHLLKMDQQKHNFTYLLPWFQKIGHNIPTRGNCIGNTTTSSDPSDFCVNFFFRFAAKLPKLVHEIVLRIQLVVHIMYTIFQTGFTHSIVLANLTRADALVDSFPSTIDNS
jgi:hypothetical protein